MKKIFDLFRLVRPNRARRGVVAFIGGAYVAVCGMPAESGADDSVVLSRAPIHFRISPAQARSTIQPLAHQVLRAIQKGTIAGLTPFVRSDAGLHLTPYSCPQPDDVVLSAADLKSSSDKKFTWGHYDGSGDSIQLTTEAYFKKFVYDADYTHAATIYYNEVMLGPGADQCDPSNQAGISVEYFIPPTEHRSWRSLRLLFEPTPNGWSLSRIIHDEPTI